MAEVSEKDEDESLEKHIRGFLRKMETLFPKTAVRVFASTPRIDTDGDWKTDGFTLGCGNAYAHMGHVRGWLAMQDEGDRARGRE